MIYINPVILFIDVCDIFSSLLITHACRGGVVTRKARSEKGGKYVLLRYRGRGGNRGKLVSVAERESE